MFLKPRVIYQDPFRGGDNILVLCDTFEPPRIKEDGSGMTDIVVRLLSSARLTSSLQSPSAGDNVDSHTARDMPAGSGICFSLHCYCVALRG